LSSPIKDQDIIGDEGLELLGQNIVGDQVSDTEILDQE